MNMSEMLPDLFSEPITDVGLTGVKLYLNFSFLLSHAVTF